MKPATEAAAQIQLCAEVHSPARDWLTSSAPHSGLSVEHDPGGLTPREVNWSSPLSKLKEGESRPRTGVSTDLGFGRWESTEPGPPGVPRALRSHLLTFFMKTVSCREHLSTFSFRTEMSLRVLGGDTSGYYGNCPLTWV